MPTTSFFQWDKPGGAVRRLLLRGGRRDSVGGGREEGGKLGNRADGPRPELELRFDK